MSDELDKISDLFDKLMAKPTKTPKKKDPLKELFKETVKKTKAEHDKKNPKQFQNGSGYDYTKVWNEKTNDFDYISTARVKMSEYLGRPLEPEERVFFVNRKLKGEAKYSKENLLLGDRAGINLSELVCDCCGKKGKFRANYT